MAQEIFIYIDLTSKFRKLQTKLLKFQEHEKTGSYLQFQKFLDFWGFGTKFLIHWFLV